MPENGELFALALTVFALIASGAWTDWHFRSFAHLPGHYDFAGKPTRLTPRRTMAWLLPITFSVLLTVIVFATANLPREIRNGDPMTGTLICCFTLLAAQGFVLSLHKRWAREQR